MVAKTNTLELLFEGPTVPFRAVKRKGELRYIASNRRGSLAEITRFAPPTKSLPKLFLRLGSLVEFRLPGLAEPIQMSREFLEQASALLQIPVDRIGVYVGEPNDRRKLVVVDTAGESQWVLKMAVGEKAEVAIRREALGANMARGDQRWAGMVPEIRQVDPVCGREAILIERVKGNQLTPEEFGGVFFQNGMEHRAWGIEGSFPVGDWVSQSLKINAESLTPLIEVCRETGALALRSHLGAVHGDFAPWNVLRIATGDKGLVAGGRESQPKSSRRHPTPPALCAIDWEFSCFEVPIIFDKAYAAYCYSEFLGSRIRGVDDSEWNQLVALGALWKALRGMLADHGYREISEHD